jgi:o-succinylbenzoate---CoA ligase
VPSLRAIEAVGNRSFVDALLEAWDAGDAVLPVDPRLPSPAAAALVKELGAGAEVRAGDALVMATSGTTGRPKGVVLTHDALRASALATSARLSVDPVADRWLACLPLAHVGGLSVVIRALITGTSLVVHDGFDSAAVVAAGTTLVSLVPTALQRIDPSLFRWIVLGGSAPPDALPANVVTTYGMTETGSGVVYDGVPLDGVELSIVGGEIRVRGPMLLRAYRTADGEHDPRDTDGWLSTGDAGWIDDDGRLVVSGRMSDLIITGGENVWPGPVEDAVRRHPSVADVAVAGVEDPEWGQRVVAYVVPAGTAPPTLEQLRATVKEVLPAFAAPRELVLVESLPRTAIGKVARAGLTRHGDLPTATREGEA